MVFLVYTMEEDFGIFMEGDFRISWCTLWKLKMVFGCTDSDSDSEVFIHNRAKQYTYTQNLFLAAIAGEGNK